MATGMTSLKARSKGKLCASRFRETCRMFDIPVWTNQDYLQSSKEPIHDIMNLEFDLL
jgi:hypothetical protein